MFFRFASDCTHKELAYQVSAIHIVQFSDTDEQLDLYLSNDNCLLHSQV